MCIRDRPGKTLLLTIDQELNQKIAQVLQNTTTRLQRPKAAAIALNPHTGEVLALVSLPTFDNNLFNQPHKYSEKINALLRDETQPLFNRVISGEYPPGSTFKIMISAAALQENLINQWTQILSTGGIQIDKWYFPDWQARGHGLTNITKALAESVNTFFYYIGGGYQNFKGLGLDKIINYAIQFNFGKILGIDLSHEASGFIPTREWKINTKHENWYIGDTYHLSIGQGSILVTPLQIANLTATIANGGKIYRPHLVKQIFSGDIENPQEVQNISPKILNSNFIDKNNIEIIQQGLQRAVTHGSASYLNDLPFTTAGKTGTAQAGENTDPHAWFTVYAPYENPEIVLTILIENGGEGSTVALPVAKEILRWYFQNKD